MKRENVIVTGGAGFIGSSICKALQKKSFNPIVIDDLSTGLREMVKFGEFEQCDVGDYEKMVGIFNKYKPIAVFHIAGSKSVAESMRNPLKYYDNNMAKSHNLLKAVLKCEIKNFIFSSSAAIFGAPDTETIREDTPKNPISPYGFSKLATEKMLESYDEVYGLKYSALRYFNVSGSDPELEVGEIFTNPTNIFPLIILTAAGKRGEFTIYGDDYKTKDGTCVRDYIHVWDLANAHVMALEKQLETKKSAKINLGNGCGFSNKEIVEIFRKITGIDFKANVGPRRIGDPDLLITEIGFAKKYLGWEPKFTNIQDHARHAWEWYKKLENK